jgi:hypothetical protein
MSCRGKNRLFSLIFSEGSTNRVFEKNDCDFPASETND